MSDVNCTIIAISIRRGRFSIAARRDETLGWSQICILSHFMLSLIHLFTIRVLLAHLLLIFTPKNNLFTIHYSVTARSTIGFCKTALTFRGETI